TWVLDAAGYIPFGGRIRMVESVMPAGAITTAANAVRYAFPNALPGQGAGGVQAHLRWGEAVKGKVSAVIRMDVPVCPDGQGEGGWGRSCGAAPMAFRHPVLRRKIVACG